MPELCGGRNDGRSQKGMIKSTPKWRSMNEKCQWRNNGKLLNDNTFDPSNPPPVFTYSVEFGFKTRIGALSIACDSPDSDCCAFKETGLRQRSHVTVMWA